jgi:hypothetical protein
MQKKKNKKGVQLNLYNKLNYNIIDYYSLMQVVKAKLFQE